MMVRRTPRLVRVAALVLAVAMAAAGSVSAASRQATPDGCKRAGHHCAQVSLIACCCSGHQDDGSTPTSTPSDRAQPTSPGIGTQAAPVSSAILPDAETATAEALTLHAPPHGFRFVDIPTLLSTFLI
jgi:hypothetical protein